jgi:hypothetical protein
MIVEVIGDFDSAAGALNVPKALAEPCAQSVYTRIQPKWSAEDPTQSRWFCELAADLAPTRTLQEIPS